jgi:hypothetical protein
MRFVNASRVLIGEPSVAKEKQRSGTWATVRYARRSGWMLWLVVPDGTAKTENG